MYNKVESQIKYLDEIRAYSGKLNLVELYRLIERINTRVNSSICQGTGRIPILDVEKEKAFLLSLPSESVRNQYKIKRYERNSTIITTNINFSQWGDIFGDPLIAGAIIDRLLHHATVITIKGKSYRLQSLYGNDDD